MITDWDALPLVMTTADMAALLRVTTATIQRRCRAQKMRPKPMTWSVPYRWYRESVRADFERGIPQAPARRQYFTSVVQQARAVPCDLELP